MSNRSSKAAALLMSILLMAAFVLGAMPAATASANTGVDVTVTHPDMNTIKLSWNKVSGATGYNVYYSSTQNGTYKLVSSIKDDSIIFNNLTTDTYYYFEVVAYTVKSGARVEGASSGILKVRSNRIGIDVSKWQGTIDWKKVKEDGIEFAFVRVSYGTSTTAETKYKQNIEGAQSVGIPVGVYIYSTATTTAKAKEEANHVLNLIKGYNIEYPVVFDIEADDYHNGLSKSANTNLVKAFCEVIEKAGYEAVLYTGCNFSETKLNMSDLKAYDWWIPHYGSSSSYVSYGGKYHFKAATDSSRCAYYNNYTRFWQYSERGSVKGISGTTDMNYELHLDEPKTASTYVELKTGKETYVAGANETISSIATKLGISASSLVAANPGYTTSSKVEAGKSIVIDTQTLTAPYVKASVDTATSIKLSYDAVPGADGYYIYSATSEKGTYKKIATISDTEYVHKGLSSNDTYYYKVAAYQTVNGSTQTETSEIVSIKLKIDAPTNVKAVSSNYNTNKISWTKVSGATGYKVYSSTSKNGTYKLVKTTTSSSYSHSKLAHKTTVYYKVKAYVKGTNSDLESSFSSRVSAKPVQPAVTNLKMSANTDTSITLSFTKSADADYYKVYRATSKDGTYKKVATVKTTTYKNTKLSKSTTYYYKVRAYRTVGSTDYASYYSDILEASTASAGPKITSIEGYSKRVYMTWDAVKNATGYEVYRSTSKNGTYKLVTSKTGRTVNNTGLADNTTYYYKVRSYRLVNKVKVFSNYSEIKSVKTSAASGSTTSSTTAAGPKIKTIEGLSGRVYMTWDAVKNAAGYEVYRSTSKTGTYKLVTSKTGTTVNNTGLEANTTYYYKVRYYTLVKNQKVFSEYSEIKSVKTLK